MNAPQRRIAEYELYEEIGRGGMGVVYRARQAGLERDVAVKVLPLSLSDRDKSVERFRQEARLTAAINDPNVITIHDFGEESGELYLVMAFLRGGSLAEKVEEAPVPEAQASRWIVEALHGLQAAHDGGVIHRDIKPANILLTSNSRAVLTDFGIARLEDAGLTTTGGRITGTFAHMAPEVIEGQRPSRASDVYSVGSTLYELLRGQPAFLQRGAETSVTTLIRRILWEAPEPLTRYGVSSELWAVVERAMAKNPADRHQTADGMADAVEAARAGPSSGQVSAVRQTTESVTLASPGPGPAPGTAGQMWTTTTGQQAARDDTRHLPAAAVGGIAAAGLAVVAAIVVVLSMAGGAETTTTTTTSVGTETSSGDTSTSLQSIVHRSSQGWSTTLPPGWIFLRLSGSNELFEPAAIDADGQIDVLACDVDGQGVSNPEYGNSRTSFLASQNVTDLRVGETVSSPGGGAPIIYYQQGDTFWAAVPFVANDCGWSIALAASTLERIDELKPDLLSFVTNFDAGEAHL